jgi:hypothetical protein
MPTTNIFCTRPNWATNLNPNLGFAVQGDNNVANCLKFFGDGKKIKVNWYWTNANSWFFRLYDLAAIPPSVTITSLTGWWYSTRQGGGNGVAQMRHRIGTSPEVIHVANHTPQNGAWKSGAMSKPGGGSWTRADVVNLQTRIVRAGGAGNDNDTRWEQHYVSVVWSYTTPQSLTANHKDVTTDGGTVYGSYDANGEANTQYRMEVDAGFGFDSPAWQTYTGTGVKTVEDRVVTGLGPSNYTEYRLAVQSSSGIQYSSVGDFTTLAPADLARMITLY